MSERRVKYEYTNGRGIRCIRVTTFEDLTDHAAYLDKTELLEALSRLKSTKEPQTYKGCKVSYKSPTGGKRAGAGRPKTALPKHRYTIDVDDETHEAIKAIGPDGVRAAIKSYYQNQPMVEPPK